MTLVFVAIASLLMDDTLAVCQWQVEVTRLDKPFTKSAFVQDRQPLVLMSKFMSNISVANMDAMVRGHLSSVQNSLKNETVYSKNSSPQTEFKR